MTEADFTFKARPRTIPFRPRPRDAGYLAFGSGDGTVLVERDAARRMRDAADAAYPQETGGLLYGHPLRDDAGGYVLIVGFVQAGPDAGASGGFQIPPPETARLRDKAARAYPATDEVGWWHSHCEPSLFSSTDLETQRTFRVGLLVFARGTPWGTAYLGTDCLGGPQERVDGSGGSGSANHAAAQKAPARVTLRLPWRWPRLPRRPLLAVLMITIVLTAAIATIHFLAVVPTIKAPRISLETPQLSSVSCYVTNDLSKPETYSCFVYATPDSATVKWTTADGQVRLGSQVTITGQPHEQVQVELIGNDHRQLAHREATLP